MMTFLPLMLVVAAVLFYTTAIVSLVLAIQELTKPSIKSAAVFYLYRKITITAFVFGTILALWMLLDITGVIDYVFNEVRVVELSVFSDDLHPVWAYLGTGLQVIALGFLIFLYRHLNHVRQQLTYRVISHD